MNINKEEIIKGLKRELKIIVISMLVGILIFGVIKTVNATEPRLFFEKGKCIKISQSCGNCTFINISQITYIPNSTQLVGQTKMTNGTNPFNYNYSL